MTACPFSIQPPNLILDGLYILNTEAQLDIAQKFYFFFICSVPDVRNSEYLNTIGSKLAPGIDVMWTGGKVISRLISLESIDEVAEVLRRKPVIWDNLHANDYDKNRLFLGPYSGRPSSLM